MPVVLFLSVLLIAACGLIYELIAGTLASYLLGDSVLQFSTVIGTYLFAMGLGSAASRYLRGSLVARFVHHRADGRRGRRIFFVRVVPGLRLHAQLSTRAVPAGDRRRCAGRAGNSAADANSGRPLPVSRPGLARADFDYLGALAASIAFPLWLVPKLGLVRAAILFGIINAAVALWSTFLFSEQLPSRVALRAACVAVLVMLGARHGGFQLDSIRRRQSALCRRSDLRAQHPLSAHRHHQVER